MYFLRFPQGDWNTPKHNPRVICWQSEQGPMLPFAKASASKYDSVAINNKYEEPHYVGKKLYYLPFGCYNPPLSDTKQAYDVVVSSNPHYNCLCAGDNKKISVDIMIRPLLGRFITQIYGMWPSEHGWGVVPGVTKIGHFEHWEHVEHLRQGKLYVDCTWNWRHGGYGCKLARALTTGVPVIWHKTVGMELDGLEKGNQLDWSASPEETVTLVDHYLTHDKERIEMGLRGREWFSQNWEYGLNFLKIAKEIDI